MPTTHVNPAASGLLQQVADILGRSRKMVIVTGAGISTNSGIPDFRSENGLYSLIQEQFERADVSRGREVLDGPMAFRLDERPSKRRRVSLGSLDTSIKGLTSDGPKLDAGLDPRGKSRARPEMSSADGPDNLRRPSQQAGAHEPASSTISGTSVRRFTRSQVSRTRSCSPRQVAQYSAQAFFSQDSGFSDTPYSSVSSRTEEPDFCSASARQIRRTRTSTPPRALLQETCSSSPLSSPPPVLFDPYDNPDASAASITQDSSACSETSDSDLTQQSLDILSSQASQTSLRNMKGRDLFDCNIWADPLKTSVFYRFATSLRQRVKDVSPTLTHRFIAQVRDVGKLARVYTQNIDEIEKKIGLSTDLRSGAGNKKRKSAKYRQVDSEEESLEVVDALITREGGLAADSAQAPAALRDPRFNKPRPTQIQDKGVECVFLHGSLHYLRCFVCGKLSDWDEDGRESCTLSGEQPECPHCVGATAARQEKGKRALGVGKLRPDIVLYGEEHPQSDLISPIVQHDLASGPDLLLILGTSLRVHGLKVLVKQFAKAVHQKAGKVVFINLTRPSESAWGDVLDYWIEWDCDAWVDDLKRRKPLLWLSGDEIQELERQKCVNLAERKKENQMKKRDAACDKRRHTVEVSKPRPPPKNPSAMRNDYHCAAYVVWEIFQTLAKIGDRSFDNLGYTQGPTQVPPVSSVLASSRIRSRPQQSTRSKKARKSTPKAIDVATIAAYDSTSTITASCSSENIRKDQYTKAAKGLAQTGKPPTPSRWAILNQSSSSHEAQLGVSAPVKIRAGQRKRNAVEATPVGSPAASASSTAGRRLPFPQVTGSLNENPYSKRYPVACGSSMLACRGPDLPPLQWNWNQSPSARIEPLEPDPVVSPSSPLGNAPAGARIHNFPVYQITHPMIYSDPLLRLPYHVDYQKTPREPRFLEDKTPSPSDQLQREWETAYQLSQLRNMV